ncbi:aromatic ring-hydroxylating oxygenase subunit alpha [Sphingomonas sp. 8AM]|uniref:aromatic ring-hydroxylating oxygenase subunit alpha n=1 Tax=Sphingomonas sp. 8AM TaxID=2653170 RepID=UPI0012EF15A5|nr:SRPBCC family protein [Sphingomonas sp. 8AM]VXD00998.1 Rieske (2Fe-2S) protein [Sphingomonas sp. 8AM]
MIPRGHYYRDDVLEQEINCLFQSGYEFVCLLSEVANDKDFVCIDYRGCAVVVQNFKGELRAFQNVCTHRFNAIQHDERGNRSLTCQYHGWTFNSRGCPIGVEARVVSGSGGALDLCLPEYRIDTCGQFVFIKRSASDLTLPEFLGGYYAVLEEISQHLGPVTLFRSVPHKANWKVLVENVIDNVHCPILHRDTFVAFGFCRTPVEQTEIDGPHSSWHVPRVEIAREKLRARAMAHLDARAYKHNSFYHIYIFPNLFIASTEGASFYIGHALPIGPETTSLRARYLGPRVELKEAHRARQDVLDAQSEASGLRIVEEDRFILESIQRGVRLSTKPGAIVKGEPRIEAFMKTYVALMDGNASSRDKSSEAI